MDVKNLYVTDEYMEKNPSLHEEDSAWKIGKIIPALERLMKEMPAREQINLLDVGGGAGVVLSRVSAYLSSEHGLRVNKYALDLSPGMLKVQHERNPDLRRAVNEDITATSFKDKELDLVLMIDVLEHVPDPVAALKELKRISHYVLFKVPLENNTLFNVRNLARGGRPRQQAIEDIGHINTYTLGSVRRQVEAHAGEVLHLSLTNVFDYWLNSEHYRQSMNAKFRLLNRTAASMFQVSPRLCSLMFGDFVMMLVKCG